MPRLSYRPLSITCAGLAALALAIACSDPAAPARDPLLGTWVTEAMAVAPHGWYQSRLSFGADGSYAAETRHRGVYAGQTPGQLSSFTRTEGRYRVVDGALVIELERLVWWDAAFGGGSQVFVQSPHPWGDAFDATPYEVRGDSLVIHFVSAPADEPMPSIETYRRGDWTSIR